MRKKDHASAVEPRPPALITMPLKSICMDFGSTQDGASMLICIHDEALGVILELSSLQALLGLEKGLHRVSEIIHQLKNQDTTLH